MTSIIRSSFAVAVFATLAFGQQPNSGFASMQINGSDMGSYPILTNVRTSLPAGFSFGGASNQPYTIFQANGAPIAGTTSIPASNSQNVVNLPLTPFPVKPIDGFANPIFSLDIAGAASFAVLVPNAGAPPNGIPLGTQLSVQAVIGDPFSSIGATLTAATGVTVTQGPTVAFYTLGDENNQSVTTTSMPIPFYGINYTTMHVNANGYIAMGTAVSDFTPTPSELTGGPPRVACFWSDLDCPANAVKVTIDSPQGSSPGYVRVDWINVQTWTLAQTHNFGILLQNDGFLELIHSPVNNASLYDQLTGISPGNNIGGTQTQKNFIGAQPTGSSVGPGILSTPPGSLLAGVNESIFEWFGIVTQHAFYTNGYDNPYDLFAQTLHFLPSGSGSLPGSTNRYTLY